MPYTRQTLPNRQSIRLKNYDYSNDGAYFITICTHKHVLSFGEIHDGAVILNELGKMTQKLWEKIALIHPHVELDDYVVMPNHLHGIVFIIQCGLSENQAQSAGTLKAKSLGTIVGQFKRAITIYSKSLEPQPAQPIWQRSYYEHVIRNDQALTEIRKYILENPARWSEDRYYAL